MGGMRGIHYFCREFKSECGKFSWFLKEVFYL